MSRVDWKYNTVGNYEISLAYVPIMDLLVLLCTGKGGSPEKLVGCPNLWSKFDLKHGMQLDVQKKYTS